jgi:cell division protein FtsL
MSGAGYYGLHSFREEVSMRRLIESLMPDTHQIYWGLVGGVFAFYVVLMVTAAGVFINHESTRKLVHENAATVASEAKRADSNQPSKSPRQLVGFD